MKSKMTFLIVALFLSAFISFTSCTKDGEGTSTSLRILPGFVLSACIDTYTGKSNIDPQTLMAAGGSPFKGYTWSIASQSSYPMGTTVLSQSGIFVSNGGALLIKAGQKSWQQLFTVEVSDGTSTKTGIVTLNVTTASSAPSGGIPMPGCPEALLSQMNVGSFVLDDAYANKPYGASLFAMGGTPPYSWHEDTSYSGRGDFDQSGLTIDQNSGIVRGTLLNSSSGKTLKFRVIVQDAAGDTDLNSHYNVDWTVYSITVK
jgi:hypothetical protein